MYAILFEDEQVSRLSPIALGRPAYAITCGGYRLADLARMLFSRVRGIVRSHLARIQAQNDPDFHATELPRDDFTLLLNARVVPSAVNLERLTQLIANPIPGIIREGEIVLAALLPPTANLPGKEAAPRDLVRLISELKTNLPVHSLRLDRFDLPHEIVSRHLETISANLEHRLRVQSFRQLQDGVFVSGEVQIGQHVVFDTRKGPILIEDGTTIGPFCFLRGPAYLGQNVKVIEHSAIKDAVSLGHTTKVGGEVEGTVIEPFSNKQHHGFLGHSYLGSWINLGAGTSNSDLKNTYGTVKMEYQRERVQTEMQFLGSIIGDYAKTAINTGIFTGKTIGVCSMLYGFVTTNVPSFVNYARLFGQVTEIPPEVMVSTQERMFERRKISQTEVDIQLIHDMYLLTQEERQLTGEPLVL